MMKFYLLISCITCTIFILDCQVIPNYLPRLCSTSTTNYNECSVKVLSEWGPYLLKGIKEINFPKLHPLNVPLFIINRTLNDDIAIDAVIRNSKIFGFNETMMKSFKIDPHSKTGHMHLLIPAYHATLEYVVAGHISTLKIENSGYFKGIATDVGLVFEFKLKPVERLGVRYFDFEQFSGKGTISGGHFQLLSKNPDFQFAADLIANFFNADPKRIINAVQPLYDESVTYFFKSLAEKVLATVPAAEILPE